MKKFIKTITNLDAFALLCQLSMHWHDELSSVPRLGRVSYAFWREAFSVELGDLPRSFGGVPMPLADVYGYDEDRLLLWNDDRRGFEIVERDFEAEGIRFAREWMCDFLDHKLETIDEIDPTTRPISDWMYEDIASDVDDFPFGLLPFVVTFSIVRRINVQTIEDGVMVDERIRYEREPFEVWIKRNAITGEWSTYEPPAEEMWCDESYHERRQMGLTALD